MIDVHVGSPGTINCDVGEFRLGVWWSDNFPDSGALSVFIDGSLAGIIQTQENATVDFRPGNHSYAGRWNSGSGFVGNLQEVRLFHSVKNEDYFTAEHDNFCTNGFYDVGFIAEAVFEMEN